MSYLLWKIIVLQVIVIFIYHRKNVIITYTDKSPLFQAFIPMGFLFLADYGTRNLLKRVFSDCPGWPLPSLLLPSLRVVSVTQGWRKKSLYKVCPWIAVIQDRIGEWCPVLIGTLKTGTLFLMYHDWLECFIKNYLQSCYFLWRNHWSKFIYVKFHNS